MGAKKDHVYWLKPGDPIPQGTPSRSHDGNGYIRLSWKVGPYSYIRCYEHRLIAGLPPRDVHHENRQKDDNRPSNLEVLTRSEHRRQHTKVNEPLVKRLYESGLSTRQIGRQIGHDPSVVLRALQRMGVPRRTISDGKRLRHALDRAADKNLSP